MIGSSNFTALLDACVLYPAPLRDLLLHCAFQNMYRPKWSQIIQDEWIRNLLKKRADLEEKNLKETANRMNMIFGDANVEKFKRLIPSLELPDKDDNHVLAAAIKGNAEVIVTFNLKDFPKKHLQPWDIEAQHPDDFLNNIIQLNPIDGKKALDSQIATLKNPPKTKEEMFETFLRNNLPKTVELLKSLY